MDMLLKVVQQMTQNIEQINKEPQHRSFEGEFYINGYTAGAMRTIEVLTVELARIAQEEGT